MGCFGLEKVNSDVCFDIRLLIACLCAIESSTPLTPLPSTDVSSVSSKLFNTCISIN